MRIGFFEFSFKSFGWLRIRESFGLVELSEVSLELTFDVFKVVGIEVWDTVKWGCSVKARNHSGSSNGERTSHAESKYANLLTAFAFQKFLGGSNIINCPFPVQLIHIVARVLPIFGAFAPIDVGHQHLVALPSEMVGSRTEWLVESPPLLDQNQAVLGGGVLVAVVPCAVWAVLCGEADVVLALGD